MLLALAVRLAVGALLTLGGISKLIAGGSWRTRWLDGYGMVPKQLQGPMALSFAVTELVGGVFLASGVFPWLGIVVLGLATTVTIYALGSGRVVDCGCLGSFTRQLVSWRLVARNVVLIGVTGAALLALLPARIGI